MCKLKVRYGTYKASLLYSSLKWIVFIVPLQDGEDFYTCNCTSGFEGMHCEEDIDECKRNIDTCTNGATCVVSSLLLMYLHIDIALSPHILSVHRTLLDRTPAHALSITVANTVRRTLMSVK